MLARSVVIKAINVAIYGALAAKYLSEHSIPLSLYYIGLCIKELIT